MTNNTIGVDDWKIWQVAQRLSRRTVDERIRVIQLLHAETGIQPVTIEAIDVVEWIADHDEWSDATAATYVSYLSAWFKWLQIMDRRSDNPMVKVGTPRVPEREPRPVSDADVVKLLQTRMWTSTRRMILLVPKSSVAIATPTAQADGPDPRDNVLFAELIDYPAFKTVDRDTLIDKAHGVCALIEAEGGGTDGKGVALGRLVKSGLSTDQAIGYLAASVKAYCPEYLASLR